MSTDIEEGILTGLILAAALLYSSVGHGGASGYIAAMAFMGVSTELMRPNALVLNVFVAGIAMVKFYRVGAFSWALFWPFALTSIPFAYLGGTLTLPGQIYKPIVGIVLIYASWHTFRHAHQPIQFVAQYPKLYLLLIVGAVLGFISGLTGVGGGIFLSPLILYFRWAEVKVISGVAAAFILVNSVAGLLGVANSLSAFSAALPYWIIAVAIGGFIGAEFGSKRLNNLKIKKILALVLLIAGAKMIGTA
jgi:hypothetical protein